MNGESINVIMAAGIVLTAIATGIIWISEGWLRWISMKCIARAESLVEQERAKKRAEAIWGQRMGVTDSKTPLLLPGRTESEVA